MDPFAPIAFESVISNSQQDFSQRSLTYGESQACLGIFSSKEQHGDAPTPFFSDEINKFCPTERESEKNSFPVAYTVSAHEEVRTHLGSRKRMRKKLCVSKRKYRQENRLSLLKNSNDYSTNPSNQNVEILENDNRTKLYRKEGLVCGSFSNDFIDLRSNKRNRSSKESFSVKKDQNLNKIKPSGPVNFQTDDVIDDGKKSSFPLIDDVCKKFRCNKNTKGGIHLPLKNHSEALAFVPCSRASAGMLQNKVMEKAPMPMKLLDVINRFSGNVDHSIGNTDILHIASDSGLSFPRPHFSQGTDEKERGKF